MPDAHAIQPAFAPRRRQRGGAWGPAAAQRSTVKAMAAAATKGDHGLAAEEAGLARAAAAGDGSAFAALYERYERRAYNLAYRIAGSEPDAAEATQEAFLNVMRRLPKLGDRELAFGSYLFTATRNACYDLIEKRRHTQPSEAIPESATPLGAGGGSGAPDPGDPEQDPDRKLLLEAQQEEIREANLRLPERQREALALRELEELSYDEIAAIMEMNRNSVAQLISRARINLRDELRGTALASIALTSPECERALPLIAMREDDQLADGSGDAVWLDAHLAGCDSCRLGTEAMQEAGASYRAWAPIAVAPRLLEETMAKAAELAGADWGAAAEAASSRTPPEESPGMPRAYLTNGEGENPARRRRGALVAAGLAAVLLGGGVAAVLAGGEPSSTPDPPAAETQPLGAAASQPRSKPQQKRDPGMAPRTAKQTATEPEATAGASPPPLPPAEPEAGAPSEPAPPPDRQAAPGLQPTRATSGPRPKPKPAPQPVPVPDSPADPPPEEDPPPERTPVRPPAGVPPGAGPPRR
jgi:RNA polymerase sigma-70 factor (ECF subfamily)